MTAPPVPDPRVDVLLTEVAAIRRQLDSIGHALGVQPQAAAAEQVATPTPTAATPEPRQAPAPKPTPRSSTAPELPFVPPTPPVDAPSPQEVRDSAPRPAPAAASTAASTSESKSGSAPASESSPHPFATPAGAAAASRAARTGPRFTAAHLLAAGGAVVTILGVGFLLAVAIAAGLFGPVPRVLSMALLSGALAFAAGRLRSRSPEASVALAATSTAAAFAVVVAATSIYEWLPSLAGVVLGVALTGAGVFVAHRWRSPLLAALVQAQIFLVLPMILWPLVGVARVHLMVFLLIAYLPSVVVAVAHKWVGVFRFASAGVLLVAATGLLSDWDATVPTIDWIRIAASFVAVLVVLTVACILDSVVTVLASLGVLALATLSLRATVDSYGARRFDIAVALALAAALAVAAYSKRGSVRPLLAGGAALQLVLATFALPIADELRFVLIAVESLALLVAARATRSVITWWCSVTCSVLAIVLLMSLVTPTTIFATALADRPSTWTAIGLAVLIALIGGLQAWWARLFAIKRLGVEIQTVIGLAVAVYGISTAIVAFGVLPTTSSTVEMGANVATTLVWVAVAIAILRGASGRMSRVGYVVLAVAVAKLFLADLQTVDGILRAVLFVVTGLGLIGAATQLRKQPTTDAGRTDAAAVSSAETDSAESDLTD